MAAVQGAVVQRRDVPRAVVLPNELRQLAPVLVNDVVHARLRGLVHELAPAARVGALAAPPRASRPPRRRPARGRRRAAPSLRTPGGVRGTLRHLEPSATASRPSRLP